MLAKTKVRRTRHWGVVGSCMFASWMLESDECVGKCNEMLCGGESYETCCLI